ncbi:MAG: hypothetical protein AAGM22_01660 [Acidobacteriota bacterium]
MYRHDTLWKGLIQAFFPDFLKAVVPDIAADLRTEAPTFLEQEAFADLPEGKKALVDLLAEVPSRSGRRKVVLVHIEVERTFQATMDLRMWRYFAYLSLKYSVSILPIVLFLRGGPGGVHRRRVEHKVGDHTVNQFTYWSLGLSQARVHDLLEHGPLGVALAACVRRDLPKDEQKLLCMSTLAASTVDPARQHLLLAAIQTYLKLNESERMKYADRMEEDTHSEKIGMMELTWAGELEQEYRLKYTEVGRQTGRRDANRRFLLKILASRFGEKAQPVADRIRRLDDADVLEELVDMALEATDVAEVIAALDARG